MRNTTDVVSHRSPLAGAVLLGLVLLAGCGGGEEDGRSLDRQSVPSGSAARGEGFNLLLISLDTTRADHLGCYGHPEAVTLNIDRLAAAGTLFEQCVAPTPLTLPSHASLMTGVDPFVHGVRYNGAFRLDDANRTLAEVLSEGGYATAAELGSYVLNSEFGMAQGFGSYGDLRGKRTQRRADEVTDVSIARLREAAATVRPFFLFAHYFDPHQPYDAPAPFSGRHSTPYVDEIAYTDEHVGRLLAELDTLGIRDRTLVVVIGDHGESLGEHGEDTHSFFIYDATTAVPLIFHAPGRVESGRRVAAQVRLIDVAPTIVEFLGMGEMTGVQGVSLAPALAGGSSPGDLPAYSETLFPRFAFGYSQLRSLRAAGWKYIHAPRPELYDLSRDPAELNNLAAQEPDRAGRMREQMRTWIADAPVPSSADAQRELSEEDLEKLRSLGYVGGATATLSANSELELFDPRGTDPKDRVEVMALSARALAHQRDGELAEAERVLRRLFEVSPDEDAQLSSAHELFAKVLVGTGRHSEAVEHYRKALASGRAAGEARTNLGATLLKTGRVDEALAELGQALREQPVFASTYVNYGAVLLAQKRYDDAIGYYRQALGIDPTLAEAHVSISTALVASGRAQEAFDSLRQAVASNPESAPIRRALAEMLIGARQTEAALQQYQALARLTPDDARVQRGLGLVYLQQQRPDQAIEPLSRSVKLDPTSARAWYSLSAAQAALGRIDEAIRSAERAQEQARRAGQNDFAERIGNRIREYRRAGG